MRYSTPSVNVCKLLIGLLLVLVNVDIFGQLKANFEPSVLKGCSPLLVTFKNTSVGTSPSTTYQWYTNDPNAPVGGFTQKEPSWTYLKGGQYTVTLIIKEGNQSDTITITNLITVFPKPEVSFTVADTVGCVPFKASFTNTTTMAPGTSVSSYFWNFVVSQSSQQSPSVTYNSPGDYKVTLTVTDNNGCFDFWERPGKIKVKAQPKATFTATGNKGCVPPLNVMFKADETSTDYVYSWDLEGQTGPFTGQQIGPINYPVAGKYDAKITVSGPGGCLSTGTRTDYVVMEKPVADFSLPASACANNVTTFPNNSTGDKWQWDFGSGSGSTVKNGLKNFPDCGTYPVKLIASSSDGLCKDSVTKNVQVECPKAAFDFKKYSCQPPYTPTIQNQSTGASSYYWTFKDVDTKKNNNSSLANPSYTFNYGVYIVYFEVKSPSGCTSTTPGDTIVVDSMDVDYTVNDNGCIPKTMKFEDATKWFSDVGNPKPGIKLAEWTFHDSLAIGVPMNHDYKIAGEFDEMYKMTNDSGCFDFISKTVQIGDTPVATFTLDNRRLFMCSRDSLLLIDHSHVRGDTTLIDSWDWRFTSHDSIHVSSNQQGQKYAYFSHSKDTGWYNMLLIVGYHGCLDSLYADSISYRYGPAVNYIVADTGCTKNRLGLKTVVTNYQWLRIDFGDGSSQTAYAPDTVPVFALSADSIHFNQRFKLGGNHIHYDAYGIPEYRSHDTIRTTHYYDDTLRYTYVLDAFNRQMVKGYYNYDSLVECHTDYFPNYIKIPDLIPEFAILDTICYSDTLKLIAERGTGITRFNWYVDGVYIDSLKITNVLPSYNLTPGIHEINLIFQSDSCPSDTMRKTVTVISPFPVITPSTVAGCNPLRVTFTGQDTSGLAIDDWLWTFPGATKDNDNGPNPPERIYNDTGTYKVSLTLTNYKYNCRATLFYEKEILVTRPTAAFTITKTELCTGDLVNITNQALPVDTTVGVRWFLYNGTTTTQFTNLSFPIDSAGAYIITQIVDIAGNCFDSIKHSFTVDPKPKVSFMALGDTVSSCYPFVVKFVSTTQPDTYTNYSYQWDLGEGSVSPVDTGVGGYNAAGLYDIKLKVTTATAGCTDSLTKPDYITVKGPSGILVPDRVDLCVGDEVCFTVKGLKNLDNFLVDFADGSTTGKLDSNAAKVDSVFCHRYIAPGKFPSKLILESGDCKVPTVINIRVNDVVSRFLVNGDTVRPGQPPVIVKGCGSLDVTVNTYQPMGQISGFKWFMDDGGPFRNGNMEQQTYGVGNYKIYLAVEDVVSGCQDTMYQDLIVYPAATATAGRNDTLCPGDSLLLTGKGGVTYLWSPGDGLSSTDTNVVWANPGTTRTYTLEVTDANGCSDDTTITIFRDLTRVDFALTEHTSCDFMTLTPTNLTSGTNYRWYFDNAFGGTGTAPTRSFSQPGKHYIRLTAWDIDSTCAQTKYDTIVVYPLPQISIPPDQIICYGDTFTVSSFIAGAGPLIIDWTSTDSLSILGRNTKSPKLFPLDSATYFVTVSDTNCTATKSLTIRVDHADADVFLPDSVHCEQFTLDGTQIVNNSFGRIFLWEFNANPAVNQVNRDPNFTYYVGTHRAKLTVTDLDQRCRDVDTLTIIVHPKPPVDALGGGAMCNYDSVGLSASGAATYSWSPPTEVNDSIAANTYTTTNQDGWFVVTGTDVNGCTAMDSVKVTVHPDFTYTVPDNDTIVIGDIINYDVTAVSTGIGNVAVSYTWTPPDFLSCDDCPDVTMQPLKTTCYTVKLVDDKGCYPKSSDFCVIVDEKFSVDVPNAFTPNGDGRNDKLYVRGFGIKKLINFTIYNRWGEVVFETTDINSGWDGSYKEKLQNDETYAFTVNAETWTGKLMSKNGYITLLK
ncbi:MAG: PKD domain-containing protein [Bacteroidota bacterium]